MTESRQRVVQAALAALAVSTAVVAVWAAFAPRSFYDDFPGGGRSWVSADGPYNEHLVRDVGELYLGLVVVLVAAVIWPRLALVRVAAVAAVVSTVPHFVYHARHLDVYETSDKVGNLVTLGIGIVLPLVVLWMAREEQAARVR
jgi:hypothetical protein